MANDNWLSPPDVIRRACLTMGGIDLDPCAHPAYWWWTRARYHYTPDRSAITRPWHGRVYMNPPYSNRNVGLFVKSLMSGLTRSVTQAVVLVNNGTDTRWGQSLLRRADAVCFPKRLAYIDPRTLLPCRGNRYAQMICYFDARMCNEQKQGRVAFLRYFEDMGPIR